MAEGRPEVFHQISPWGSGAKLLKHPGTQQPGTVLSSDIQDVSWSSWEFFQIEPQSWNYSTTKKTEMLWNRTAVPHNTGTAGPGTPCPGQRGAESHGAKKIEGEAIRERSEGGRWGFDKIHRRKRISLSLLLTIPPLFQRENFNMQKSCPKYPKNSQEYTHYPDSPVVNILHIYFIIIFLTTSPLYNCFP